jgi:DNA-binding response OmpR family regulator
LPAAVKPLIEIAHKNSERLILLVNDILDMEKIEAGKMEFDMQPLQIMPLLKQALDGNRAYGEQFGVGYEFENELPDAMIKADANRLMQVLANLLSNAAKFSPQGGKVLVAAECVGQRIRISVKDNGHGIPDEFKGQIFQKFAQADSSDTKKKGGTGLGLSITRAIVEQMNGRIGFTSQPNVLTSFFVEFPFWQEAAQAPPPETAKEVRILICEDDHDIAALLRLMLEQAGLSADIAYNAAQAKELLGRQNYSAMTLDLSMPNQDGISLIRELRAANTTLPIVVVTANATEGRKELNGDAFSVVDWIGKPIDQALLIAALKQAIGQVSDARAQVLHIEDDPDIALVVNTIVGELADVDHAATLSQARRILKAKHYDLAILDISLPDGSGLDLLPELNAATPAVPVMVFSASEVSHENLSTIKSALVKSRTDNAQLLATIRRLIETK